MVVIIQLLLSLAGKRFYGPGGPYAAFAGRDASRGLATFSVAASDDFDDLADLTPVQKESVKEWETQFTGKKYTANSSALLQSNNWIFNPKFAEKYEYIGRLLRPGELSRNYSDGESEGSSSSEEEGEQENSSRPKSE